MVYDAQPMIGMNDYLQTFRDHLASQNKRSFSYLNRGLSSFYEKEDFMSYLGNLGSDAVRRSTVNGGIVDEQIKDIAEVEKVSSFCMLLSVIRRYFSVVRV